MAWSGGGDSDQRSDITTMETLDTPRKNAIRRPGVVGIDSTRCKYERAATRYAGLALLESER